MTTYTVKAPDGKMITLEGPPGASEDDVIAQAQKLYTPGKTARPANDPISRGSFIQRRLNDFTAPLKEAGADTAMRFSPGGQYAPKPAPKTLGEYVSRALDPGFIVDEPLKYAGAVVRAVTDPITRPAATAFSDMAYKAGFPAWDQRARDMAWRTGQWQKPTMEQSRATTKKLLDDSLGLLGGGEAKVLTGAEDISKLEKGAQAMRDTAARLNAAGKPAMAKAWESSAKAAEERAAQSKAASAAPPHPAAPTQAQPANALKAATKTVGNVIEGEASKDPLHHEAAARLEKRGIRLTLGQKAGGEARRVEEARKSNPLIGKAIREREGRALTDMNRATYNLVLEPLGVKVPDEVRTGRDGIQFVDNVIAKNYETIAPDLVVERDRPFFDAVDAARKKVHPAERADFDKLVKEAVDHRFAEWGTGDRLQGARVKETEEDLGHLATGFRGSQNVKDKMMGDGLFDVQKALRESMERHSAPGVAEKLKKINHAFAGNVRLQTAAANRANGDGIFTPGDLSSAVKRSDKSVRKSAFAKGEAMMQDFSDDVSRVLPNRLPDSGTAERQAHMGVGSTAGALLGHIPGALAGAALDYGVGKGTNALAGMMMDRKAASTAGAAAAGASAPSAAKGPGALNSLSAMLRRHQPVKRFALPAAVMANQQRQQGSGQ